MTRRAFALYAAGVAAAGSLQAGPRICVQNVRRAFHNGEHNAFTDLTWFQGRIYLAFRSCPDGHMIFPTSTVRVLVSENLGQDWREVHRFSAPQRDVRDPHFLVFQDKLFVYSGTWYCGEGPPEAREANDMLGYAAVSADGEHWEGPYALEGTYGHYIWRAAEFGGKAFLCGRRKKSFDKTEVTSDEGRRITQSVMLESDDGLIWRTRGLFQEEWGNETAFQFASDGTVTAVARTLHNAQDATSRPPNPPSRRCIGSRTTRSRRSRACPREATIPTRASWSFLPAAPSFPGIRRTRRTPLGSRSRLSTWRSWPWAHADGSYFEQRAPSSFKSASTISRTSCSNE
jgi:hypothetical protein